MGCLHLQFAERLPSAHRGGKLRAQANLVNSGRAGSQHHSLVVAEIWNDRGLARAKIFFDTLFLFSGRHARFFFPSRKFFCRN